jgi:ubiquinone/menaquinone biosynthesis C-methylase UbiE
MSNGWSWLGNDFRNETFTALAANRCHFPTPLFDRAVSSVALPYMDIPKTLAEVRRVLKPGGSVMFSVHPLRFTLGEFRKAVPHPMQRASGYLLWRMDSIFT